MSAKRFFCGSAGILCLALVSAATAATPVGVNTLGNPGGTTWAVFMDNGDIYNGVASGTPCPWDDATWTLPCNVYSLTGYPAVTVPVVGVRCDCTGNCFVVNAAGDMFRSCGLSCCWNQEGNLFSMAGRPQSEIVYFSGAGCGGTHMYFMTAERDVYTVDGSCAQWIGRLPPEPTPTQLQSWGLLKTLYR